MMRRAFSYITSEVRGLHAAAYILAVSSLLSSVLALLRDRLLAHVFGAGYELDLYYAAFRIPDAVFIGVGALVSAYMLIPELARRDEEGQKRYIDSIVAGFSIMAALVSAVAFLFAPYLLTKLFPSIVSDGHLETMTLLTRILLMQAILLGFSNIAAALTQFKHRYALYALSPILYNLGIIFGAIVLYPVAGLSGLAWGVVLGAASHVLIQIPSIVRDGFFRRIPWFRESGAFLDTVRISLPRALSLSMNQLAFLGLVTFAGTLATGSISVFIFAFNLNSVPLSIIGASYATAAFPTLAYAFSRGNSEEFLLQVSSAARHILFWTLPVIAVTIVLRAHIVRAVLGSGAFDWTDTRLTAAALALLIISLAAQSLMLLLIRAFYASGKTVVPFAISLATALMTILFASLFLEGVRMPLIVETMESLLRVRDVLGSEVLVLPLSYTISSIIGLFVLLGYFESHFRGFLSQVRRSWWESLFAGGVAGIVSYLVLNLIGDITLASTFMSILMKAALAGFTGLMSAAVAYFVLGNREFAENVHTLKKRLWRGAEAVTSAE